MDRKQWKQNQRIKRAFLPVIMGLLAIMIMLGGYWQKVIQGVTEAAEQIDAAVYLGGIDNETDVSGQIFLIEKAEQQGADGILLSSDASQAMVNRVSGFLEYWAKYAPEKWTINQDIRLNGGDVENAQADVAALLTNNKKMKGLYGCNNTSTKGIAAVLMKRNRQDIVMAGFDLAYEGMLSLDRQIRGETPEQKYIDTGVLLVPHIRIRGKTLYLCAERQTQHCMR